MGNSSSSGDVKEVLRQVWREAQGVERRGWISSSKKEKKRLRHILQHYDTNDSGMLSKAEALRYLRDLLEVSGLEAVVVTEAKSAGEQNVVRYYNNFVEELFNEMDEDGDELITFDELLRPAPLRGVITAVSQRMRERSQASRSTLIRSSRMQMYDAGVAAQEVQNGTPCVNSECAFFGLPQNDGYCATCHSMLQRNLRKSKRSNFVVRRDSPQPSAPPAHVIEQTSSVATEDITTDAQSSDEDEEEESSSESSGGDEEGKQARREARREERGAKRRAARSAAQKLAAEAAAARAARGTGDAGAQGDESVADEQPAVEEQAQTASDKGKAEADEAGKGKAEVSEVEEKQESEATSEGLSVDDESSEYYEVNEDDMAEFLEEGSEEESKNFVIYRAEDIEALINRKISDLCELLGLSKGQAALVLFAYDWKPERVKESWFSNLERNAETAGVSLKAADPVAHSDDEIDCSICWDDYGADNFFALDCQHEFCKPCWRSMLHDKCQSSTADSILATTCMQKGCSLKVTPDDWKALAKDEDYERFHYFFIKSFVESTPSLAFCPSPGCTAAVRFTGFGRPMDVVECYCGKQYCFGCHMEYHNPITCDQLEKWRSKGLGEKESMALIMATAKTCPHCGVAIERNEGCNHMTCRTSAGGCGGEWCWMCRGDWKTHGTRTGGYFSCNLYDKSDQKKLDEQADSLKAEADRFNHFHDRFLNHHRFEESAVAKKEVCLTEWMPLYRIDSGGQDPTFLLEALELLIKCRHVLKYTYVFAFFADERIREMEKSAGTNLRNSMHSNILSAKKFLKINKKAPKTQKESVEMLETHRELFNFQQANLEGITDRLGEFLFSDGVLGNAPQLRQLHTVTSKYLKNLVAGFQDMEDRVGL